MRQDIEADVLTSDGRIIATSKPPFSVEAFPGGADLIISSRARVRLDRAGILSLVYALLLTYREDLAREEREAP